MEFEGRARIRTQLDVTPLIDVVFLLLIFFLLTSTYITRESIELNLPSSDTAAAAEDAPVVVGLDRENRLYIGDETVSAAELEARLARSLSGRSRKAVTLKADRSVELQSLLDVIDRIRSAGATELSLATGPESLSE
jgi:biopolymer transport protein ExbD